MYTTHVCTSKEHGVFSEILGKGKIEFHSFLTMIPGFICTPVCQSVCKSCLSVYPCVGNVSNILYRSIVILHAIYNTISTKYA